MISSLVSVAMVVPSPLQFVVPPFVVLPFVVPNELVS
jgi:hypothetical protein